ncbi:hypothetical protein SDC9_195613 [bioreactor metagenome]|uniref:Uncharacterized protein n=1 Tax=bioreactor metagenome TaxID=1076179 RepID=A0A645IC17_9ZZZZ
MVKDVHVVKMHPFQALVEARDQVLAAAVVAVGAGPHVVASLRGDDELVPVGVPVPIHVDAKVPLRLAVGRAVVVREVKVRHAAVKSGLAHALHGFVVVPRTKVMPEPQREQRQL